VSLPQPHNKTKCPILVQILSGPVSFEIQEYLPALKFNQSNSCFVRVAFRDPVILFAFIRSGLLSSFLFLFRIVVRIVLIALRGKPTLVGYQPAMSRVIISLLAGSLRRGPGRRC